MKSTNIIGLSLLASMLLINHSHGNDSKKQNEMLLIAGIIFEDKSHTKEYSRPLVNLEQTVKANSNAHSRVPRYKKTKNKKTRVKNSKKERFIEGYKLSRKGKGSKYVYGEITEIKNDEVFGYLYNKKGNKTYIYGQIEKNRVDGIYAKDNQSNEYLLKIDN